MALRVDDILLNADWARSGHLSPAPDEEGFEEALEIQGMSAVEFVRLPSYHRWASENPARAAAWEKLKDLSPSGGVFSTGG
jgi:hypothetical protein